MIHPNFKWNKYNFFKNNYNVFTGGSVLEEGNIIIDSGTTLTLLPVEFYSKLESEVARHISLRRVEDPQKTLSLCYSTNSLTIKAPIITVHFRGADVNLNPLNTFVKVSPDTSCFAFSPNPSGSIFGNLAQMNFLVGYDIRKGLVSFTPTDCTKFWCGAQSLFGPCMLLFPHLLCSLDLNSEFI